MELEIPALGRPFSLGMLYDCRCDKLIPGITLWKREALEKVSIKPQDNTAFEVLTSDSLSDKSTALKINGSLKVSYLFGLVDVGGSAMYLKDTKKSKKSTRVTLKYFRTTRFEQLSMNHLCDDSITFPSVFEKGTATHVVTGILYGAQAFFIFDQDFINAHHSRDLDVNANIDFRVLVKQIPQAAGKLPMSDKEKEEASKFSCTFHGDFALEKNPVTFEEAVKLYANLPKLLGGKGEKAVPVKIWLHPLKHLDDRAAHLVREIKDSLVFRAEKYMQQISDVMMQCNELKRHPAVRMFPNLYEKVHHFQDMCESFTFKFQKQLSQVLPSIRGGILSESQLEKILNRIQETPFRAQRMLEFVKRRQQEMDVAESYLKALPGITVVPTQIQLQKAVNNQCFEYAVCFNLSPLEREDVYLLGLEEWLSTEKQDSSDIYQNAKSVPWFEEGGLCKQERQLSKIFQMFAMANENSKDSQFLVSAVYHKNSDITIFLYESGDLVDTNFKPPGKPDIPLITKKTHSVMELLLQPSEYGKDSVKGYKVEYNCGNAETWTSLNTISNEVTVSGLKANTCYQFRYSAMCKAGLSVSSEVKWEKTLCCSPPRALQITAAPDSLQVSWKAPLIVAEGLTLNIFRVEYKEQAADTWFHIKNTSNRLGSVIHRLKSNSTYTVRVLAVCEDEESIASEEIEVSTTAEAPTSITCYPYQEMEDMEFHWYHVGKNNLETDNKVILVVGDERSEKFTLLNSLDNYVQGVQWKDNVRSKLPRGNFNPYASSQATVYSLNHQPGFTIPYSLTLIETPDFTDQQQLGRDNQVIKAIRDVLARGFDNIDAVCFVVTASPASLTSSQIYTFQSVCSFLGKDLKENLKIIITSCDAERPPILDGLKTSGIPFPLDINGDPIHYKFNLSALNVTNDNKFNQLFWEAGKEGMRAFLAALSSGETRSLRRTLQVAKVQDELEECLLALQDQITDKRITLEEMKTVESKHKMSLKCMEEIKDFEYKDTHRYRKVLKSSDNAFVTCSYCEFVCHFPCQCDITNGTIQKCSAIDKKGNCQICPNKCTWRTHFIQEHVTERDTDCLVEGMYSTALEEVTEFSEKMQGLQETLSVIELQERQLVELCCQHLRQLANTALSINPLLSTDTIELMIQSELTFSQPLCQERIEALAEARKLAQMMEAHSNAA